jgi:hypothetical protein
MYAVQFVRELSRNFRIAILALPQKWQRLSFAIVTGITKELSERVVRGLVLALAFESDTSYLQLTFGGAALFSSARLNLAIRFMDSMFRLAGGQTFLVHDPLHSHLECRPRVRIPLAPPTSTSLALLDGARGGL